MALPSLFRAVSAVALASALAACGGGGSSSTPPSSGPVGGGPTPTPTIATATLPAGENTSFANMTTNYAEYLTTTTAVAAPFTG